jgi:hypothetical protein
VDNAVNGDVTTEMLYAGASVALTRRGFLRRCTNPNTTSAIAPMESEITLRKAMAERDTDSESDDSESVAVLTAPVILDTVSLRLTTESATVRK